MRMAIESQFSDEDIHLIETHQLGMPLNIYRLKPGYISLLRWIGLLSVFTGIFTLLFTISVVFVKGTEEIQSGLIVPPLVGSFYALFHGGVFYRIMHQRARYMHIIVCEHGLLQFKKKSKSSHIEVVHWQDILTINKAPIGKVYSITYRGDKPFNQLTLPSLYQNLNELVAFITERREQFAPPQ